MKDFLSFLMYGGIAASVNLVSRWIFSHWLPYSVAISLAFIMGLLTGFLLFKFFVFTQTKLKGMLKEAICYILVNIIALLQTLPISLLLVNYFFPYIGMSFYPYEVAHAVGVVVPVITSYYGHKYFTFN